MVLVNIQNGSPMASSAKRYRIEDILSPEMFGEASTVRPVNNEQIGQILATVQELRSFLDPSQRLASDIIDAYRREVHEVYQMKAELDAMKEAITSTKLEIASIHRSDYEGKGMRRVAGELDAVVGATEAAATTILAAVEEIETQANMLRATGGKNGVDNQVDVILDRVVSMYEACNFQDLTGQRISKIVTVMKFVEDRLDRMIGVWGGLEAFKELVDQQQGEGHEDDERALLNGPKLATDDGHVDQGDIDALFD
jgi:chemotaxis protein CheZ